MQSDVVRMAVGEANRRIRAGHWEGVGWTSMRSFEPAHVS